MEFYTWLEANHCQSHRKTQRIRREPPKLSSFVLPLWLIDWTNQDQREVGNVERKLLPPARPPEVTGIGKPDRKPMNFIASILSLPWSIWKSKTTFVLSTSRWSYWYRSLPSSSPESDNTIGASEFLLVVPLCTDVDLVNRHHLWTHRDKANTKEPVRRHETAGEGR